MGIAIVIAAHHGCENASVCRFDFDIRWCRAGNGNAADRTVAGNAGNY